MAHRRLLRRLVTALAVLAAPAAAEEACRPVFDAPPPAMNACADAGRVTVALVGDLLLHSPLQRRGYRDGFDAVWGAAAPFLRDADIAVANLEGPVAAGFVRGGGERSDPGAVFDNAVYSSYPLFNYHPAMLVDLRALGIDLVTTANNHGMDRGPAGAEATLAGLAAAGIAATGTVARGAPRAFATESRTPLGTVVWIACSYSTNGMPDPDRQTLQCYRDRAELLSLVRAAAGRGDVAGVVVLPHWGIEYSQRPDADQTALARDLAAAGAMLVVGTHPHTVQPWERLQAHGLEVPVLYSTGNFVSGQPGLARETGMLAWIELCHAVPGDNLVAAIRPRLAVARAAWVPLRMQRTGLGPQLFTIGAEGATGPVLAAREHIAGLVPEGEGGARLDCGAEPAPAIAVALQ